MEGRLMGLTTKREEWRVKMLAEMREYSDLPRYVYEALPSLANRFVNCETWDEAIFGLGDTYHPEETKLFFAFFCGRLIERIENDAREAPMLAKAEEITKKIMTTMDRIEQKLGTVEGQHKDILDQAEQIRTKLEK
jgi:hypothetical protein